jgi:hypothetical protein
MEETKLVASLLVAAVLSAGCLAMSEEDYEDWAEGFVDELWAQSDRAFSILGDWERGFIDDDRAINLLRDVQGKVEQMRDEAADVRPPEFIEEEHGDVVRAMGLYAQAMGELVKCIDTYDSRHCDEADLLIDRAEGLVIGWDQAMGW